MRNRLVVGLVMALVASLCIGCNKNQETPSSSDLLGKWYVEFHENELGGDCFVEYSFQENGELALTMNCAGEEFTVPMLWRTEGDILYAIEKESEEFYKEENLDWIGVSYKLNGNTLEFYENGKVSASFTRKN